LILIILQLKKLIDGVKYVNIDMVNEN